MAAGSITASAMLNRAVRPRIMGCSGGELRESTSMNRQGYLGAPDGTITSAASCYVLSPAANTNRPILISRSLLSPGTAHHGTDRWRAGRSWHRGPAPARPQRGRATVDPARAGPRTSQREDVRNRRPPQVPPTHSPPRHEHLRRRDPPTRHTPALPDRVPPLHSASRWRTTGSGRPCPELVLPCTTLPPGV